MRGRGSGGRGRGRGASSRKKEDVFAIFQSKKNVPKETLAHARIKREIEDKCIKEHDNILIWFPDKKNVLHIKLAVKPHEGMFKGLKLVFDVNVPARDDCMYPERQPELKLIAGHRILHPNINNKGEVCLGFRRQNPWIPVNTLNTVALSAYQVLLKPNSENAQDGCKEIAMAMASDDTKFKQIVAESLTGRRAFGVSWPSVGDMDRALEGQGPGASSEIISGDLKEFF